MFERFTEASRLAIFRARENALADCEASVNSRHLLLALIDLHSQMFEAILNSPEDLQRLRDDLRPPPDAFSGHRDLGKLRLDQESKRALRNAMEEARSHWRRTARQRSPAGHGGSDRSETSPAKTTLPQADLSYWQNRTGQAFSLPTTPTALLRWLLRRRWEVDVRHILLGVLAEADCPTARVLMQRGVTLEAARERLLSTDTNED